ncbi:MAG: DUF6476 family protein [Pseudomonadota bacterium]
MSHYTEPNAPLPEPANLRFLRILVTSLTAIMILGVLGILVTLFLRLNQMPLPPLSGFNLPPGVVVQSASYTDDYIFVVGSDGHVYAYDVDKTFLNKWLLTN